MGQIQPGQIVRQEVRPLSFQFPEQRDSYAHRNRLHSRIFCGPNIGNRVLLMTSFAALPAAICGMRHTSGPAEELCVDYLGQPIA
jgi:hypothetical protein